MQDAGVTLQGAESGRPRWEWPIVIGLLLISFFFRVWQLNDVPPGLHHDEVIIGQVAKDILRGQFGIYFTAGYGHEPLYHYIVAGMFGAIDANAFVLRLTSAFIAMLGLASTYVFVRRIFSPVVASGALAWMSISLWSVFFARVGLRGITLPLLTTLTAYFLWRALFGRKSSESSPFIPARFLATGEAGRLAHPASFILPGVLLGLTLYTYQASRIFPLILGLFLLLVFVRQWRAVRRLSHSSLLTRYALRSVLTFFVSALIVAAPLIIYLTVINPSAESRVADLSGPLNQLRTGDPSEVISSTLNTLGMFTYRGDAVPIYNVGGRPVFPEIFGAALFAIGLLICLWRWRRPAYALMLLWFFISLIPAMVTPFSPNFVRTIAAWPAPFVFAGIAMNEAVQFVGRRSNQHSALRNQKLTASLFAVILALNAASTFNDYFVQWPTDDYVRFWQQATWTQAVRALNADRSSTPIAASGLSIHDFDPQTFDLLGLRSDLKVKWFDCRNAMLYPQDGTTTRYLAPAYLPCDADLQTRFWPSAQQVAQPHWPDTGAAIFTLHELNGRAALEALGSQLALHPVWIGDEAFEVRSPEGDLEPAQLPLDLSGLSLLGWETEQVAAEPGEAIDLFTYWKVTQPIAPSLKLFMHVTGPDGKIVAQWDGLDVNIGLLEAHDVFVQRHRLELPADLPPGPYRISIGAYQPDTGQRLKTEFDGRTIDSIVLGLLTVQ
jgi:4-amino-4-deoxy-L-arabinose transferase-like glycosyltransferase